MADANVSALLCAKIGLLERIAGVTGEMPAILEKQDIEGYGKKLDERQTIMDEIDALDQEILKCGYGNTDAQRLESLKAIFPGEFQKMRELIVKISELESSNRENANAVVEEIKGQISQVKNARQNVASFFGGSGAFEGVHFDSRN